VDLVTILKDFAMIINFGFSFANQELIM
jgi:hypothetical protein